VDFSLADKIAVAGLLDRLGLDYVEGGYPGREPPRYGFLRQEAHEARAGSRPSA
jgi:2-isopropylmalate synthase